MKITIDGPSASGKSTIAKGVSKRLGIPYLETGLAYRAVGYYLSIHKPSFNDLVWEDIEEAVDKVEIIPSVGTTIVMVEGERVEDRLRSEEVGRYASIVGTFPKFREYINAHFRKLLGDDQAVVEGRDAGTHIFPDAPLKIFITADPEVRAKRRYEQLRKLGMEVSYEEILSDIVERDKRDTNREKYPLRPAEDAILIDTSDATPEEIIDRIVSLAKER